MERHQVNSSLQKCRGYWYVQCRIYDLETGEQYRRKRSTKLKVDRNKRRALAMIPSLTEEIMEEFKAGSPRSTVKKSDEPLLSEYIDLWLKKRARTTKENTMYSYRMYANKFFLPAIGNMPVKDITYRFAQNFYDELAETHKSNSLRKYNCVLKGALDEALKDGVIMTNPATLVEFPRQDKFKGSSYTIEQMNALLQAVQAAGEPLRAAVILAGCYGLRREEALGLRWKDIDFDNGILHVRNTVVYSGSKVLEVEKTKTKKSQRDIPLVGNTVEYLKQLKQTQIDAGLELDKVVVWPNGKTVKPQYITRSFSALLEENGLPQIRFHDLRHTAATLLSANGVKAKQISEFLGHESIVTTLDIYADVYDSEKFETSAKMSEIYKNSAICFANRSA